MKRVCTALFAAAVLLFSAMPLTSAEQHKSPHSIGALMRIGPYSFLALDVIYQMSLNDMISLFLSAGPAADLQLFGSSSAFQAVETGGGVKFYFYDQIIYPYGALRAAAAIPVEEGRDFVLYGAAAAGAELRLGRLFFGVEAGIPLKFMGDPPNEAFKGDVPIYAGASLRFQL